MKIQVNAKVLEAIVSTAAQAISSKPLKSESECVYISVNSVSGTPIMTVQASDAGMTIRKVTDNIKAMEDGEALIPAKTLLAFLKLMKDDVTLEADESTGKCTLKNGGKRSTISGMGTDDYDPSFVEMPNANMVRMQGKDFDSIVESTLHCISTDTGRMILTGINFAFDGEKGICEGSGLDGFILANVRKIVETNDTFSVTIPATMAKLIGKIIKDSEDVSFRFENGMVLVEDYDTAIQASLLSGEYMNIKRLMFREGKMQARVNAEELLQAVRMAMISAQGTTKNLIILNFESEDSMSVTARSDFSSAISGLPCDRNGEMNTANDGKSDFAGGNSEIAFDGRYVEDALKAAMNYAGEVTLLLNTPVAPMAILPVGRDDYYQLVLPVRRLNS